MINDLTIKCFDCGVNDYKHTVHILDSHTIVCNNCGRTVEYDGSKTFVDGLMHTGYYEALFQFILDRKMTNEEFEELLGMMI